MRSEDIAGKDEGKRAGCAESTHQGAEATTQIATAPESSGEVGGEMLLFFHPDHLGSTNYVTDDKGKLFEHLQYFPFGETWVREAKTGRNTPYLFTSNELDQETGLYYFGARYYDPRTSVWISADPALGLYLDKPAGIGGIFNSTNLNPYAYAGWNPLNIVDPDGLLQMKASAKLVAFTKAREGSVKTGERHVLYDDPAGKATIGFGHKVSEAPVGENEQAEAEFKPGLTEAQATALLRKDLKIAEAAVNSMVTAKELTQNQFDALVDLAFNVGEPNLKKSNLIKLVNAGDFAKASTEFNFRNAGGEFLKGLENRSAGRQNMFSSGTYGDLNRKLPTAGPAGSPGGEGGGFGGGDSSGGGSSGGGPVEDFGGLDQFSGDS